MTKKSAVQQPSVVHLALVLGAIHPKSLEAAWDALVALLASFGGVPLVVRLWAEGAREDALEFFRDLAKDTGLELHEIRLGSGTNWSMLGHARNAEMLFGATAAAALGPVDGKHGAYIFRAAWGRKIRVLKVVQGEASVALPGEIPACHVHKTLEAEIRAIMANPEPAAVTVNLSAREALKAKIEALRAAKK